MTDHKIDNNLVFGNNKGLVDTAPNIDIEQFGGHTGMETEHCLVNRVLSLLDNII